MQAHLLLTTGNTARGSARMIGDLDILLRVLDPDLFQCSEAGGAVRIRTWVVQPDGTPIDLYAMRSGSDWILVSISEPWHWVQEMAIKHASNQILGAIGFIVDSEMARAAQFFDLGLVPDKDAFIQSGIEERQLTDAIYRLAFGVLFFVERMLEETRLVYKPPSSWL